MAMTLCIDFDGVLHSYVSGWKGARNINDPPVDGAIDWLLELVGTQPDSQCAMSPPPKYNVCIFSTRNRHWGGIRAMKKWLIKHGVDKGYFTDGLIKFPLFKPPAFLTIDDRAMTFTGVFPTDDQINDFRTWQQPKRKVD